MVLGGLGSVSGSLIAAFVVGYLETLTAYLVSPAYRTIPALLLLVAVMYVPAAGPAREALGMGDFFKSTAVLIRSPSSSSLRHCRSILRLYSRPAHGRLLFFGVLAMAWDLLFGFDGEVIGPTFLIGVGAYTAGNLTSQWLVGLSVHRARRDGVGDRGRAGVPALRVRGPYFGLRRGRRS